MVDADAITLVCSNGTEIPCEIIGNVVYADCTAELSENPGYYVCKLKIEKDDEILYTQEFGLWVENLKWR